MKNFWYKKLEEFNHGNIVYGIAENKSDLEGNRAVFEKAEEFAQSIDAIFYRVSCKNNTGIQELFQKCIEKYLEQNGGKKKKIKIKEMKESKNASKYK